MNRAMPATDHRVGGGGHEHRGHGLAGAPRRPRRRPRCRRGRRRAGPSAPPTRTTVRPRARCRPRRPPPGRRGRPGARRRRRRGGRPAPRPSEQPASVERVGRRVGVAEGVEAEDERLSLVVREAADPVEQASHRPHRPDRLEVRRVGAEEQVGTRQEVARELEPVGVEEDLAELVVVGRHGQRDRQRVAVARDGEVLHEPEVAAQLGVGRQGGGGSRVPAGEVDEPALDRGLGHVDVEGGEPVDDRARVRPVAATTTSASRSVAVVEPHAGHDRAARRRRPRC